MSLRGSLEGPASSAALSTGDWLTTLTRAFLLEFLRAWPRVLPVTMSRFASLLRVHAKSHRELCLVPLVRFLGQLPAVWGSLRAKPRWFGQLLSKRFLLLSPRF